MRSRELRINIFVYVRLVKFVKEKMVNFFYRTHEQIKPVKENLSRKTCSSYTRASEHVKKTCQGKLARLYGALAFFELVLRKRAKLCNQACVERRTPLNKYGVHIAVKCVVNSFVKCPLLALAHQGAHERTPEQQRAPWYDASRMRTIITFIQNGATLEATWRSVNATFLL